MRQIVQDAIVPDPKEGKPAPATPTGSATPSTSAPSQPETPSSRTSTGPKQGLVNVKDAC